jgi:hypothetical protein
MKPRKVRPVTARYDTYLFIALGLVFIFAGLMDASGHEQGWFFPFLLSCGVIALAVVSFVMLNRRR